MTPQDLVLTPRGLRFQGRCLPCSLGRSGVTHRKTEGDGATPSGIHRLIGLLYRPDRLAPPCSWAKPISPGDLWSDDVADPDYNLMVRVPHGFSHETLRRPDPLYDIVLLTDWNWPYAVAGRGSAIFIHAWRRPGYPTEGCIALAPEVLRWMAPRISLQSRLIVPYP